MATLFYPSGGNFPFYCAVFGLLCLSSWTEAGCPGGAEDMKLLYKKLFTDDYNPLVRPSRNYSTPTNVTLQLYLSVILGLDTKNQLLYLRAFLRVMWLDEYLQWDPNDFGCIKRIVMPQNKIWKPDFILFNAANEHDSLGSETVFISVNSEGFTKWEPPFYLEGTCKLDMTNYPFDVSLCPLAIASWMTDNQSVFITWLDEPINIAHMITNGEYKVSSGGASKVVLEYDDQFFETVTFEIKLARRPMYIVVSLLVPVNLLAVLGILSFIMPPEEPEKVAISITILLSFTVFLAFIDSSIPHTSDNVSLLLLYITALLFHSFLSVVGNVLVVSLKTNDEHHLWSLHQGSAQHHTGSAQHRPGSIQHHSGSTQHHPDSAQPHPGRAPHHPTAATSNIKPYESISSPHGLFENDKYDQFPSELSKTQSATVGHVNAQAFNTKAYRLNKVFMITSCVAFGFISCLMVVLACL